MGMPKTGKEIADLILSAVATEFHDNEMEGFPALCTSMSLGVISMRRNRAPDKEIFDFIDTLGPEVERLSKDVESVLLDAVMHGKKMASNAHSRKVNQS